MGLLEYQATNKLILLAGDLGGNEFYSLLMAAMKVADSDNSETLKTFFPEVWSELKARYNAPGGLLPGEKWEDGEEEDE